MERSTQYWLVGGLALATGGVIGYVLFSHVIAKAAQGAQAAPGTTAPPQAVPFTLPAIPELPPQQLWNDYQTLVLTPQNISPGSGNELVAVNLQTGAWRTFGPGESIVSSSLENQSLASQKIPGDVFYANEGGAVARYWTKAL